MARVTVLTKAPVAGRVKTRLIPALGPEGAARLHRAFVDATLARVRQTGLEHRVCLGAWTDAFAEALRAQGVVVDAQPQGDLGARMSAALVGAGRQVVVGTDCVVFDPASLTRAATSTADVAIAPSEDGGYWALSIRGDAGAAVHEALFSGMPWSTPELFDTTCRRCASAGLSVERLPTCYDIDLPTDLSRLLTDPRCPQRIRSILAPG